jgi:hypothetical protein
MCEKKKSSRDKRTKAEIKEYLKLRSRIYYSSDEAKAIQREKMRIYRENNREKINAKKRKKDLEKRLEKKLKIIWLSRGLIQ